MNAYATPTITPVDASFGAVVTDVDLTHLDENVAWGAIEAAFHRHALLIFPRQHLTAEAQVAFGDRFDPIEMLNPEMKAVPISNLKANGEMLRDDEPRMQIMLGNEGWHTDSSYMRVSALASILSAQVVPSRGGQTEWADMRAAYDALAPAMRERIEGLTAYHSLRYSQAKIGHQAMVGSGYGLADDIVPLRPLVKTHPVTGRKALYIGRHAHAIPGLTEAESERLLDELVAFACQPPRIHMHVWAPGDVVVWDNRCLLHRARPYDHAEQRTMRHVRISGDPVSERSLNAETAAVA